MEVQTVNNLSDIRSRVDSYITIINRSLNSINNIYTNEQKEYAQEQSIVHDTINSLLSYLVSLQVDSYNYSVGANHASQNLDYAVFSFLQSIIDDYSLSNREDIEKKIDIRVAFTAYYLLSYMCRQYERERLEQIIDTYENFFLDRFALAYQIRGRSLRDRKLIQEAIQNDKIALSMLKEEKIDNIGVLVTYASSIAKGLEESIIELNESDIDQAIENVIRAIQINRKYSKYHYLLSLLRLERVKKQFFDSLKRDYDSWNTDEPWEQELIKAEDSIQTALDYLDEKSQSYTSFLVMYRLILDRIKNVQSYIHLLKGLRMKENAYHSKIINQINTSLNGWRKEISEKTEEETKIALRESQEQIQKELKETQNRYLEILAVFVAIVGVMMTMIGLLSHDYTIREVFAGMIVMNSGLIIVYSIFKMILSNKISKVALLAIAIGCVLTFYIIHWAIPFI